MTAARAGASRAVSGSTYRPIATLCSSVLSLPPRLAAITPCRMTSEPQHGHARPRGRSTTTVTAHGSSPSSDRPTKRRTRQRLVGDRVGELAEGGDQAPAPGQLPVEPVGPGRPGRTPAHAAVRRRGPPGRRSAAGPRRRAPAAAAAPVRALGMLSGPAGRVAGEPTVRRPSARGSGDHGDADRLGDEVDALGAGDDGARTSGPDRGVRLRAAAWCRRPRAPGAPRAPRRRAPSTSTSTSSPTRSSARWLVSSSASADSRATRSSTRSCVDVVRQVLGLGAVLVGVAEHADRVEPGRGEEALELGDVGLGLAREARR